MSPRAASKGPRPGRAATEPPAPAAKPRVAVLLGAQRFNPSLGDAVAHVGVTGKIALITAGWQERESEDEELSDHLGGKTRNLLLHARANALFKEDIELAEAHRQRQDLLRHLQEIYRIRLEHAFEAERDVATYDAPEAIREEVAQASLEAIRALDNWHLGHCRNVRAEFEERVRVSERGSVQRHRAELKEMLAYCEAVAIAGGHVALLLNRLVLLGIDELLEDRPVFAWSAGAMAVSERIVLFHDDPPAGRVARQVLDEGLARVPGAIMLPEPEHRLDLSAHDRVAVMARRFAPAACLAFPARSWAHFEDGICKHSTGVKVLRSSGEAAPYSPRAGKP